MEILEEDLQIITTFHHCRMTITRNTHTEALRDMENIAKMNQE